MTTRDPVKDRPEFGNPEHIARYVAPTREIDVWEVTERIGCPDKLKMDYWIATGAIDDEDGIGTKEQWAAVKQAEADLRSWGRSMGLKVSDLGMWEEEGMW